MGRIFITGSTDGLGLAAALLGDPRVLVLVGLPGSGKSTWGAAQGCAVLASDEIRHCQKTSNHTTAVTDVTPTLSTERLLVRGVVNADGWLCVGYYFPNLTCCY